ncbi:hypothetical protein RDI58_000441 [Solanum bulbocastanum]|uniref:Uncharacterized protein n=1 Tax=Solanum bulbocastanum TaxID=147425 RepID=A0AAN8U3D2_SOLBU
MGACLNFLSAHNSKVAIVTGFSYGATSSYNNR